MAAYTASEKRALAAAEMALTAAVRSERAFGANLAEIRFPVTMAPVTRALRANRARAKLTAEQARSSSLGRLRPFNHRVAAAAAAVQVDMKLMSKALAAPM